MRSWKPSRRFVAGWLAAGLVLGRIAGAEEPDAGDSRRVVGSDPSEIVSRLEIRNEYLGLSGGGHSNATIFRGDWAPTDWILGRIEIPLVATESEEHGSDVGLGDLLIGVRGKARLGERWSLIGEMAAVLDTAASDLLGAGSNLLAPQGVLVWKPSRAWILGLQVQWLGSLGGGGGENEQIRETAIRPQALYHLPYGFWILADPRIYVDSVEGTRVAFFPEGELGNVVAQHVEVWIRGGGNAAGDGREERLGWVAEAGIRYLFD